MIHRPPPKAPSGPTLFGGALAPRDPHVAPVDAARLSGQNAEILRLLREGPRSNVELARVSLKYTSRVSDLRAAGYAVECRRGEDGLNWYTLNSPQGPTTPQDSPVRAPCGSGTPNVRAAHAGSNAATDGVR